MPRRTTLNVYSEQQREYSGTIKRTIFNESSLGNWNTGTVSVLGKRYRIIGRDIRLPKYVIEKLMKKGELGK